MTNDDRRKMFDRQEAAMEREMIRIGMANAYAVADWLHERTDGVLEVEVSGGELGEGNPCLIIEAMWDPDERGNPTMYQRVDVSVGWPRRRMLATVKYLEQKYHDWLSQKEREAEAARPTLLDTLRKSLAEIEAEKAAAS